MIFYILIISLRVQVYDKTSWLSPNKSVIGI